MVILWLIFSVLTAEAQKQPPSFVMKSTTKYRPLRKPHSIPSGWMLHENLKYVIDGVLADKNITLNAVFIGMSAISNRADKTYARTV